LCLDDSHVEEHHSAKINNPIHLLLKFYISWKAAFQFRWRYY